MGAYLDNAATTMVCPEAAEAALAVMTVNYGNPSSTHTMGRNAAKILENARQQVAKALGAAYDEIYFTSGGTESDNWALLSGAELMKRRGRHIISSQAEHGAVLRSLEVLEKRGFEVTRLAPQRDGSIDVSDVTAALRKDTILVSLMMVNNETGGVTDIPAVSKAIKAAGSSALLHTDAVQGFLKLPLSAKTLGADLISISGHKIHAPKGVGALFIKGGVKALNLSPLLFGGGQETGRRAGTEALPLIAAFGQAAEIGHILRSGSEEHMRELKELAISRLTSDNPELKVMSGEAPHILSVSLPGYKSEVIMNYLEHREIYVSKSSACKKGGRSHVLEAAGHSHAVIDGALRISFSRFTVREDILALCDGLRDAARELFTVLK